MPGVTQICPQCSQKIINASPAGDGLFHCSGCGHRFGDIVSTANSTQENSTEPSGRAPEQSSYGLLSVAMWLLLLYLLAASTMTLINYLPVMSNPLYQLSYVLISVTYVLMALLGILTVNVFARIDSRAAWIAWRCGSLSQPLANPTGSSLRYILPLAVFGGVTVIFASQGLTDPRLNTNADITIIGVATAGGIALLMAGLACGEVRRFFWRMAEFASALKQRPFGESVGLAVPAIATSGAELRAASRFRIVATVVLIYFVARHTIEAKNNWTSGAHAVFMITGVLAFLICIAQLSTLFKLMVVAWMQTGETIATSRPPTNSYRSFARIVVIAAFISGVISSNSLYLFSNSAQWVWRFESNGLVLALWCSNLFVNLWLITLMHDSCNFADACSRFSRPGTSAPSFLTWTTRVLVVTAVLYACTMLITQAHYAWSNKPAFIRVYPQPWWFFAMTNVVSSTGQAFLAISMPAISWSLIALHLQRAADSLDRCIEVKKKREASAEVPAAQA